MTSQLPFFTALSTKTAFAYIARLGENADVKKIFRYTNTLYFLPHCIALVAAMIALPVTSSIVYTLLAFCVTYVVIRVCKSLLLHTFIVRLLSPLLRPVALPLQSLLKTILDLVFLGMVFVHFGWSLPLLWFYLSLLIISLVIFAVEYCVDAGKSCFLTTLRYFARKADADVMTPLSKEECNSLQTAKVYAAYIVKNPDAILDSSAFNQETLREAFKAVPGGETFVERV